VNCPRPAPGRAAAVITTVPATPPPAGRRSAALVIPPGEVEEHRGEHVHATDGDIGHLRALRIDPGSHQVTHVLIREGPVWNRKDVAIPAAQVTGFDDGIRLSITRQQVRDLPQASIDHPAG
jgi:hypothetical protein